MDSTLGHVQNHERALGTLSNRELEDRVTRKMGELQHFQTIDERHKGFQEALEWVLNLLRQDR